jgi:hypothetical protein
VQGWTCLEPRDPCEGVILSDATTDELVLTMQGGGHTKEVTHEWSKIRPIGIFEGQTNFACSVWTNSEPIIFPPGVHGKNMVMSQWPEVTNSSLKQVYCWKTFICFTVRTDRPSKFLPAVQVATITASHFTQGEMHHNVLGTGGTNKRGWKSHLQVRKHKAKLHTMMMRSRRKWYLQEFGHMSGIHTSTRACSTS